MKKLILAAFLMIGFIGITNAQTKKACAKTCAKTCTKGKTVSAEGTSATQVAAAYMEADKLAEANENIERRECATSGKVSYFEKYTCSKSGKTSLTEVKFDEAKKMFVSVDLPEEAGKMAPMKSKLPVAKTMKAVEE